MSFKLNPIKVVDDDKIVSIVETNNKFNVNVESVLISTLTNIPIKKFENIDSSTFIELDIKLKIVKISYYGENNEYLNFELVELENTDNKIQLSEEEIKYEEMKLMIKKLMDMPEGTELEIAKHTELLKRTTIDKNARIYVTSKIRKALISTKQIKEEDIEKYTYNLYADLYGMGAIQELDDDESIGEILVNARTFPKFTCQIYYIKDQVKYPYEKTFKNLQELENVFSKVIEFSKKELNSTDNAEIEAVRPNRDRVQIIIPDASENWSLNIRKFNNFTPNMEMMKKSGTIDDYNDRLFNVLVRGLANIGIGGFMGTGKTTLINFLLTYTDPITRKVVIASVNETDIDRVLKGHDVLVLNVDEEKGFSFENHLKASLRSTADRIIVPESRGKEFKQINEANAKTSGNIFTGHAIDEDSFLDMCVQMYKQDPSAIGESNKDVKNNLAKSMDIVVIMRKVGNKIRIKSISEVLVENGEFAGFNKLQEWKFNPENPLEGHYEATGNKITDRLKYKLIENLVPLSELEGL